MKIKDLRDDYFSSGIMIGKLGSKNCRIIKYGTPEWNKIKNLEVSSKKQKRNFTFTVVNPLNTKQTFGKKTIKVKSLIIKKSK